MFLKECKKMIRSFLFWCFAAVMLSAYLTQFAPELKDRIAEPAPGQESYGTVISEEPDIVMPAAVQSLVGEYLQGYYSTWPLSFYRKVYLKEDECLQMAAIIEELTGLTQEEFYTFDGYALSVEVSYERFKELMQKADELLGGGSGYSEKNLLSNFARVPKDYEEALAEYREDMTKDALGEVYARLYCDYMGIFLALMPVFAAAAYWDMDRRAKAGAVIYSRRVSSLKIVSIRYAALISCLIFPQIVTFCHTIICLNRMYPEIGILWGKAICLVIVWLLPELMFTAAFAMLLTELASPLLAVFLQGLWWFGSLQINELTGNISGWALLIRHNALGESSLFRNGQDIFYMNRICYFILAIACVGIEVFVYDLKRKGRGKWKS